jgi:DNA-binding LacI/PurR family transcriptional regulator
MYVPLYMKIYHDLCGRLREGTYCIGERLPGENELCKTYRSSRRPVRDALSRLSREGLLANRPGIGWEVLDEGNARQMLFVTAAGSDEESALCQEAIESAFAGEGIRLDVKIVGDQNATLQRPGEWRGNKRYEGVILLYRSWMESEWCRDLCAFGKRSVIVRCDDHIPGVDTVDMDNAAAMKRMVEHFIEAGKKRILYATSDGMDMLHPSYRRRRDTFRHEMLSRGLPLLEISCKHNNWLLYSEDEKRLLKQIRTQAVDGIIAPAWGGATSLMVALAKQGLTSDDLTIGVFCPAATALLPQVRHGRVCAIVEPMAEMAGLAAKIVARGDLPGHLHLLPGTWSDDFVADCARRKSQGSRRRETKAMLLEGMP